MIKSLLISFVFSAIYSFAFNVVCLWNGALFSGVLSFTTLIFLSAFLFSLAACNLVINIKGFVKC